MYIMRERSLNLLRKFQVFYPKKNESLSHKEFDRNCSGGSREEHFAILLSSFIDKTLPLYPRILVPLTKF